MKATVLVLALLCAGAVCAQTPSPPAAPGARHLDELATLLDLTDAQKSQVQAILQEERAKMKASFEQAKASGTKPDFAQMHALHQQLHQETLQKLTPVLSAAQMKKFQILSEHMHGRFGGRGPGHGPMQETAPTAAPN